MQHIYEAVELLLYGLSGLTVLFLYLVIGAVVAGFANRVDVIEYPKVAIGLWPILLGFLILMGCVRIVNMLVGGLIATIWVIYFVCAGEPRENKNA